MAFAIAGLFASGETVIRDVACVQTSYPDFADTLQLIRTGRALKRRVPAAIRRAFTHEGE
jgi:3-phosphoshikimate 1-carboxyvinyltransferase